MWRKLAEKVLKIYLILGGIGIFSAACGSATKIGNSYYGNGWLAIVSFLAIAIGGAAVLLLTALLFGMFTEMARHIEEIAENTKMMSNNNASVTQIPYSTEKGKPNLSAASNQTENKVGEWRCKSCEGRNPANALFCRFCGKQK